MFFSALQMNVKEMQGDGKKVLFNPFRAKITKKTIHHSGTSLDMYVYLYCQRRNIISDSENSRTRKTKTKEHT